MNESIEKFRQKIQKFDEDLIQLNEQLQNKEQQFQTKQDETRQNEIQLNNKLIELQTNEQQIQQQQNMINEHNTILQRANNNMENIKTNIAKISRSAFDLEVDLAEQQQLLHSSQRKQETLNKEYNKIQEELLIQQRKKEQHENDIRDLSYQINEQQNLLKQKQDNLTDLQDQVKQKRLELNKTQEKYNSHKEQFDSTQIALTNIDQQIRYIDVQRRQSERNIEQKVNETQTINEAFNKKRIEIDNRKQNLKRVTNAYYEKNREYNAMYRNKNNIVSKIDHHQKAQIEANRNVQETNNRLTAELRTIQRLEDSLHDLNSTLIQNLPYERTNNDVAQEAAELNKSEIDKFDQDEYELYYDLTQRQFIYNKY
ncbi:unnamed protein product [Rotaria sordida]|nr:unnamed protein product [Rotaria sordida]CAF3899089.1 unnamed protein product [Rotaria sordida]